MNTVDFLKTIFGANEGFLFISSKSDPTEKDITDHKAFKYPDNLNQIAAHCRVREDEDLYFSPMLYKVPVRRRGSVAHAPVLYTDTDSFPVDKFLIAPSINVATSPGKHASFWLLDGEYEPEAVEAAARAIALAHASTDENGEQAGTDAGGWDLSQLLRMPNSQNLKYMVPEYAARGYDAPYDVHVVDEISPFTIYSLDEITDAYDPANLPDLPQRSSETMPTKLPEPKDVLRRITASRTLRDLYTKEPARGQDWSDTLYHFISEMLRNGFSAEEAFVGAWHASCNKYKRDGRPMDDLWEYDMRKALADPNNRPRAKVDKEASDPETASKPKDEGIASILELALLKEGQFPTPTFIERYVEWGVTKTDAPAAYHVASAFSVLSCIFGEWGVGLPQWGELRLGMFFVIMGETTDTRKTTSRNLMKKLLRQTQIGDYEYILTSDSTGEALLDTLADRPHQSSLYDRDEAQQLIEDIKGGKGYLKGFFETLNEFYDGWAHGRLRMGKKTKDTPVNFVQYLMGIRSQIQENLELKDFASGWGPRNIFVRGESPPRTRATSRLKQGKVGSTNQDNHMIKLAQELMDARSFWEKEAGGDRGHPAPVQFTDEAWISMTDLEWDLKEHFADHPRYEVLKPCFERLSVNSMKAAILFAMSEKRTEVELQDVINVRYYAAQWVEDLIIVVEGVNESLYKRDLDRLEKFVADNDGLVSYASALKWALNNGKLRREFLELVDAAVDAEILTIVTDKKERRSLQLMD